MPTLVLHGRHDAIAPLAGGELLVAEDAGHVPTITRPAWVAEQIGRFFPAP